MATTRTMNGYGITQSQVVAEITTTTSMTYTQALQDFAALIPDYVYEDKESLYWLKANNQVFVLTYNPSAYAKGFTATFLTGTATSNAHSHTYTFYVYRDAPTSCTALKLYDGTLTNIGADTIASTFAGTWQLFKYI